MNIVHTYNFHMEGGERPERDCGLYRNFCGVTFLPFIEGMCVYACVWVDSCLKEADSRALQEKGRELGVDVLCVAWGVGMCACLVSAGLVLSVCLSAVAQCR
mmetsp:Transcript_6120/g.14722  ORF Transcript_6120/g.14722 Transcript_6120/m.14722 type:complete len:102 (-) Transcript_6120:1791-2096(-)